MPTMKLDDAPFQFYRDRRMKQNLRLHWRYPFSLMLLLEAVFAVSSATEILDDKAFEALTVLPHVNRVIRLGGSAQPTSGTSGSDGIIGGPGNDRRASGGGDDALDGGEGNDWLRGGAGNDTLTGGPGDDRWSIRISEQDSQAHQIERITFATGERLKFAELSVNPPKP